MKELYILHIRTSAPLLAVAHEESSLQIETVKKEIRSLCNALIRENDLAQNRVEV